LYKLIKAAINSPKTQQTLRRYKSTVNWLRSLEKSCLLNIKVETEMMMMMMMMTMMMMIEP
jgi:hypothetical protein